ncbi:hypothetical protein IKQ21_00700 [bacterium]|nr:hypothetical protein [bacterium]
MKKFLLSIAVLVMSMISVYADNRQDALNFYNNYINAANSYSDSVTSMYSPNAKIIRQVVKPDGSLVDVYTNTSTYIKQMKIAQAGAKLRQYKNFYSNIKITKIDNDTYKISSLRQPIGETYKLKTYAVVKKQSNGTWLIIEEMMQTKQQIFLKYAK